MATKKTAVKKKSSAQAKPARLPKKKSLKITKSDVADKARVMDSKVVYQGKLFRVTQDHIVEPNGRENTRDVVRHNGSAVIIAIDNSNSKKDPWIVMERQYRHAANRYLWELPAGRMDEDEDALAGAQRELEEETGYRARKWTPFVEYFASPGFLAESMKVFIAEGLVPGHAHPEDDEEIEIRLVKLSDILKQIDKGGIMDGKTLSCVLLYAHRLKKKGKR